MEYFKDCTNIEQAKKLRNDLVKQHHPDRGGDLEECKIINNQFDNFLRTCFKTGLDKFEEEHNFRPDDFIFSGILKEIIDFNITIEIIGFWIYCFDSYEYKDQLKSMGFWFSKKHKAWVFSGRKKMKRQSRLTTDEVKDLHGDIILKKAQALKKLTA